MHQVRLEPTTSSAVWGPHQLTLRHAPGKALPTVAAEVARACLESVPLGKAEAIDLVESLEPYLEWQSDAAYKADPPPGYWFPPYNMFAALERIKEYLVADRYVNELEFQEDLYLNVFSAGHDGHLAFFPDALTRVFSWKRQRSLVSISDDGLSLPVIKLYEDMVSAPDTASAVKLINGVDAATYIADTIFTATYNQDPDAAYNTMFYSKTMAALTGGNGFFSGGGRIRYLYQGPNTTFTFENGTVLTLENIATVHDDLTDVEDGSSFYAKFCGIGAVENALASTSRTVNSEAGASIYGYPESIIASSGNIVTGYYLDGEGLEDVAVIAVLAFESGSPAEFHAVCEEFFAMAVEANKTKLVVDFQGNGGGYILLGYDFFHQLFPSITPDGFSRWKENPGFNALSHIISDRVSNLDPYTSGDHSAIEDWESWYNFRFDLNLTNQPFASFAAKFSPHTYESTPYTNILRWDLTNNLTTTNTTFGVGVNLTAPSPMPFLPSNIVLLYDGICASTCALTSTMLRHQAHVNSISLGGRSSHPGLTPGVGGVKGAQVLTFADIHRATSSHLPLANTDAQREALSRYSDLPIRRGGGAVNVRDQILRENLNDGIPAQYITENADCRLFWTREMLEDVGEVWKAAARAAFLGKECAVGGIAREEEGSSSKTETKTKSEGGASPTGGWRQRVWESVKPADRDVWEALHRQRAIP
ncbi:hypothetical protein B0T14DRAFT_521409 [Immersiella caudata]|uniref:CPAF-like PDZ domain-containing protein n=1 Tax=Immersiella caudata TaxID=314043 RepID=A0AA39WRU9_9PEZI|nr:hypothetical protein B0T14DRAFT_521409 [Immersiella caudata]